MTHDTPPKRIWADQDNLTWVEEFPGEAMKDCEAPYILASEVAALIREAEARGMERAASKSETRHQLHLEQVRITNEWIADRDRLAAANAALEAKVAGLREAVDEQTKARAQHWLRRTMTAPEDAEVEALCERCGYGAVMDAASRLWARKPHGSGAFYIGGCIGFKSDEEARAALATQEAGNAQSTPPISPEEAQFNAVRYHERFGPLDEKGNPVDPRRRG